MDHVSDLVPSEQSPRILKSQFRFSRRRSICSLPFCSTGWLLNCLFFLPAGWLLCHIGIALYLVGRLGSGFANADESLPTNFTVQAHRARAIPVRNGPVFGNRLIVVLPSKFLYSKSASIICNHSFDSNETVMTSTIYRRQKFRFTYQTPTDPMASDALQITLDAQIPEAQIRWRINCIGRWQQNVWINLDIGKRGRGNENHVKQGREFKITISYNSKAYEPIANERTRTYQFFSDVAISRRPYKHGKHPFFLHWQTRETEHRTRSLYLPCCSPTRIKYEAVLSPIVGPWLRHFSRWNKLDMANLIWSDVHIFPLELRKSNSFYFGGSNSR